MALPRGCCRQCLYQSRLPARTTPLIAATCNRHGAICGRAPMVELTLETDQPGCRPQRGKALVNQRYIVDTDGYAKLMECADATTRI